MEVSCRTKQQAPSPGDRYQRPVDKHGNALGSNQTIAKLVCEILTDEASSSAMPSQPWPPPCSRSQYLMASFSSSSTSRKQFQSVASGTIGTAIYTAPPGTYYEHHLIGKYMECRFYYFNSWNWEENAQDALDTWSIHEGLECKVTLRQQTNSQICITPYMNMMLNIHMLPQV